MCSTAAEPSGGVSSTLGSLERRIKFASAETYPGLMCFSNLDFGYSESLKPTFGRNLEEVGIPFVILPAIAFTELD